MLLTVSALCTMGLVYHSWSERYKRSDHEIVGSEGRIVFASKSPPVLALSTTKAGVPGYERGVSEITLSPLPPLDEQYAKCDDFLRAIIEDRPPLVDPQDACHAVEILDAAYCSIQDGCMIELSERGYYSDS